MQVYISGPISLDGKADITTIEKNLQTFRDVAVQYRAAGHDVLSPAELPKQDSWADYMKLCIPLVCKSDSVVALPGFGLSRGSIFEVLVANTIGIPVHHYGVVSPKAKNEDTSIIPVGSMIRVNESYSEPHFHGFVLKVLHYQKDDFYPVHCWNGEHSMFFRRGEVEVL